MFTRKFERRVYIAAAVLLFSIGLGFSFGAYILWPSNREAGYQPSQPIAYSHKLHAGELGIECQYCHIRADESAHATVPSLAICMNCHQEVQTKDADGNLTAGMATLLDHWERQEPIAWNRVHDLADFAYFDHSRHLAADITCQECHGPVETYEHMRRQFGMKMSWCLDCHKEPLADDDQLRARGWTTRGPIHCTACHR